MAGHQEDKFPSARHAYDSEAGQWVVREEEATGEAAGGLAAPVGWIPGDVGPIGSSAATNSAEGCNSPLTNAPGAASVGAAADLTRSSSMVTTVRVESGELLYLPALWYHRVTSREDAQAIEGEPCAMTIAVNYWHDMVYDHRYVYHRLARAVAGLDR